MQLKKCLDAGVIGTSQATNGVEGEGVDFIIREEYLISDVKIDDFPDDDAA